MADNPPPIIPVGPQRQRSPTIYKPVKRIVTARTTRSGLKEAEPQDVDENPEQP